MDEKIQNRKIYVKSLIIFWLKKWKYWVSMGVICALVLSGVLVYRGVKTKNVETEEQFQENQDNSNESKKESYKKQWVLAKAQKESLDKQLEEKEEAAKQSFLMKIDSSNVCVEKVVYYIDNDYKISTQSVFQDKNEIGSIIAAYVSELSKDGESLFLQKYQGEIEKNEIDVLFDVTGDVESQFVTINIFGRSKEEVQELKKEIQDAVLEEKEKIASAIGEHTIEVFSEESGEGEQKEIVQFQKEMTNTLYELQNAVLNKETEVRNYYDALVAAGGNTTNMSQDIMEVESSETNIWKIGILGFVCGGFLGVCIVILLLTIQFFNSSKVQNLDEIENIFGVSFLGTLYINEKGYRYSIEKLEKSSLEKLGLVINSSMDMLRVRVEQKLLNNVKTERVVLSTSIEEISQNMQKKLELLDLQNMTEKVPYHILKNAKDYEKIDAHCAVILLEQIGVSDLRGIREQIKELEKKNVLILGYILV